MRLVRHHCSRSAGSGGTSFLLRLTVASVVALLAALLAAGVASAQILILAPHPDDDVLISAGIISDAHRRGEQVVVVYLTNGDTNGTNVGLSRQNEAVTAQTQYLGTLESDMIFLGYPDDYMDVLYDSYPSVTDRFSTPNNGQSVTYGQRGLGGSDYHFYRTGTHALYNRANVVADLATILQTYRPDQIFTTSQYDWHTDHQVAYKVLKDALTSVLTDPFYRPVVHTTVVWSPCCFGDWPAPIDPTRNHSILPDIPAIPLDWNQRESLDVPLAMQDGNEANNPKYQALLAHASQFGSFLANFVHKDEIFWPENPRGLNRPPIVNAGVDQQVASGAPVSLNGNDSSDPEAVPLTFDWSQAEGPAVTLTGAQTASPTFTAPQLGQTTKFQFRLVVHDAEFASPPDLVTVTVAPSGSVPAAPSGLTATAASSSRINLAWVDNATNETGYSVERSTNGTTFTVVATLGANVTTYANTGLTASTTYSYRVRATNSVGNSAYSNTATATTSATATSTNIAPLAAVTASSANTATGQQAAKAVDGVVDGWPGDYTREWATAGEGAGAWIRLSWATSSVVDRVVLYDRPNPDDHVTGGTLTFSDGTSVNVGPLDNAGAATTVTFAPRSITSVTFTVTSVDAGGQNIGLAEFEVHTVISGPLSFRTISGPTPAPQTARAAPAARPGLASARRAHRFPGAISSTPGSRAALLDAWFSSSIVASPRAACLPH